MIKNLKITPPIVGRISIGRTVERNGKRLPEKDDQFTITTQVQSPNGWLLHPIDKVLREQASNGKLYSIPVTLAFNDPDLNFRAEYTAFDRKSGRVTCVCDGETCETFGINGVQRQPCQREQTCPSDCKPFGRLLVKISDDTSLDLFALRTTGFNSIRTLSARLQYFNALTAGTLSTLPLSLKIRGKSTTQSYGTPIFYVDLTIRDGMTLEEALQQAKTESVRRTEAGIDQNALDAVARKGLSGFGSEFDDEDGVRVVEEFYPPEASEDFAEPVSPHAQALLDKLTAP